MSVGLCQVVCSLSGTVLLYGTCKLDDGAKQLTLAFWPQDVPYPTKSLWSEWLPVPYVGRRLAAYFEVAAVTAFPACP